ncbi:FixH family protein [Tahibacter soli]|uniref:FixH family protein n=1 Tax=Tahibacter soli TaxID=2983605 RepID=A0A9X4BJG3_9GAMM|nr:FixH family protein [Tahibacter soli]MDC8014608.1 FixH family protein [Tahibacter soli]
MKRFVAALAIVAAGAAHAATHGAATGGGSYYVEWTSEPDPLPLNALFALRVRVLRGDDRATPVAGAQVTASAWMPEHNHGTTLQPDVAPQADGSATVTGLLLHMPGHWELRIGVAANGQMERVVFPVDLEP